MFMRLIWSPWRLYVYFYKKVSQKTFNWEHLKNGTHIFSYECEDIKSRSLNKCNRFFSWFPSFTKTFSLKDAKNMRTKAGICSLSRRWKWLPSLASSWARSAPAGLTTSKWNVNFVKSARTMRETKSCCPLCEYFHNLLLYIAGTAARPFCSEFSPFFFRNCALPYLNSHLWITDDGWNIWPNFDWNTLSVHMKIHFIWNSEMNSSSEVDIWCLCCYHNIFLWFTCGAYRNSNVSLKDIIFCQIYQKDEKIEMLI